MVKTIARHGFTTIELLVVILIISILATIVIQNYVTAKIKTSISISRSDLNSIAKAIESYRLVNDNVPLVFPGISINYVYCVEHSFNMKPLTFPIAYIDKIPSDPFCDTYKKSSNINDFFGFPTAWYNYSGKRSNQPDPNFGVWYIWGNGPDGTRQTYPMKPYSITNGIISIGDIAMAEKQGFNENDLSFSHFGAEEQYLVPE